MTYMLFSEKLVKPLLEIQRHGIKLIFLYCLYTVHIAKMEKSSYGFLASAPSKLDKFSFFGYKVQFITIGSSVG